jgi:hypothetical protein
LIELAPAAAAALRRSLVTLVWAALAALAVAVAAGRVLMAARRRVQQAAKADAQCVLCVRTCDRGRKKKEK